METAPIIPGLNCKPGGVRLNDGSFTGYGRQIGYWSILPESIDTN